MQTYTSILDNPGFRIAILDVTRKTAEIALSYNISESRCRQLRQSHGRPCNHQMQHGIVMSKRWMDNKDWVHDVRTLRCKELMAKHGWSMPSCVEMRRQLGVGKQQILKSKAFREAVKSRTTAEVAAMFGLGLSVVSKYRIRFGVAKKRTASLIYDRAFMKAVRSGRQASDIAKDFGCSDTYVRILRKREAKPFS